MRYLVIGKTEQGSYRVRLFSDAFVEIQPLKNQTFSLLRNAVLKALEVAQAENIHLFIFDEEVMTDASYLLKVK